MGNSFKSLYNKEKDIELRIILNKACYYPGEIINGTLSIKAKPQLKQTIFNETTTVIKIIQLQHYSYSTGSGKNRRTVHVHDDTYIFIDKNDFINFKGSNLLTGINLPFSIEIPYDIQPTVLFGSYYIKHLIYFEIPGLESKRALMIFIKSFKKFTLENGLLKKPAIGFGDFYKKKKSQYMGGKLSCLLKLPKNSFSFFDIIPFELYLDCTELNMDIKSTKITLNKSIYANYKKDKKRHHKTPLNEDLIFKEFILDKSLNKYEIKDSLQLKENNDFFEKIYPQQKYENFDKLKEIELDYDLNKIRLSPFCLGGLISVEFTINVEIEYKMKRKKSSFKLPIQFYDSDNKKNEPNNYKNNKKNVNINYNINSINNNKNSDIINDFVIIENDDFIKQFFGKTHK